MRFRNIVLYGQHLVVEQNGNVPLFVPRVGDIVLHRNTDGLLIRMTVQTVEIQYTPDETITYVHLGIR